MKNVISRRTLIRTVAAAGVLAGGSGMAAEQSAGIRGFDHVALPMEKTDEMVAFYQNLGLPVTANANACSVFIQPDDQLSSPSTLARQDIHVAGGCRKTAVRGPLLCVGRFARVAKGDVGSSRSKDRGRSGRTYGWPQDGWLQHIRARSRRQPPGIHDLSLKMSCGAGTTSHAHATLFHI